MRLIMAMAAFLVCGPLFAQPNQDYGFATEEIPELAQFEYYRGVWISEMEMRQEDGSFEKLETTATLKGRFLEDNRTYQSKFSTDNGFFSTDIRSYNTTTGEWSVYFLNAKAQRWHQFTCQMVDGKMTTIVPGGYGGTEDFVVKVVDTVIDDHNYRKAVYHSYDDQKTWELTYRMNVRRVKE